MSNQRNTSISYTSFLRYSRHRLTSPVPGRESSPRVTTPKVYAVCLSVRDNWGSERPTPMTAFALVKHGQSGNLCSSLANSESWQNEAELLDSLRRDLCLDSGQDFQLF